MDLRKSSQKGTDKEISSNKFGITSQGVIEAGLCFGHGKSKSHPKMKPYISGIKGTIQILDVDKVISKLIDALNYIQKLREEGKTLLLVGTKIQLRDLVEDTARECNLPYVINRWIGGTFTNFNIIKKRIDYFKSLEDKEKRGELEKYTKKERINFDKEIQKLRDKFEGLKNLDKLPDAVFIANLHQDELVAKEARQKGIPVVAITDTDVDPDLADWPIIGNDDAMSSVKYILDKVKEVVMKTKKVPQLNKTEVNKIKTEAKSPEEK